MGNQVGQDGDMSFLSREIDVKGGVEKWGSTIRASLSKVYQSIKPAPKPRTDEPRTDEPLTAYLDYRGPTTPSQSPPDYSSILTGQMNPPPAPNPIPWFLSGVPEQYHKHYAEWMVKQPSGAPTDFNTYCITGSYTGPYMLSGMLTRR